MWGNYQARSPQVYYLLITNVTTHSQAVDEPPSEIISIASPSTTTLAAVGFTVSTSPAADPDCVTVIPPPVTAVPPISNDKAASADVIAFLIDVKILIIFPPSGTATAS